MLLRCQASSRDFYTRGYLRNELRRSYLLSFFFFFFAESYEREISRVEIIEIRGTLRFRFVPRSLRSAAANTRSNNVRDNTQNPSRDAARYADQEQSSRGVEVERRFPCKLLLRSASSHFVLLPRPSSSSSSLKIFSLSLSFFSYARSSPTDSSFEPSTISLNSFNIFLLPLRRRIIIKYHNHHG